MMSDLINDSAKSGKGCGIALVFGSAVHRRLVEQFYKRFNVFEAIFSVGVQAHNL